jgi:hypothetical protein
MTKPIGYFCSGAMPGDTGLIADMQSSWGSTFEALNNAQRLWIVQQVSQALFLADSQHSEDRQYDDEVEEVTERLDELNRYELLSLLEALVSQIKSNRN